MYKNSFLKHKVISLIIFLFATCLSFSQSVENSKFDLLDLGKMWTFDYPPKDHFSKKYNLNLTDEWIEKAKLSALRLPGCSGSFISEDGLVMTNHHCARGSLGMVSVEGENLISKGFFAKDLSEERKVKNFYIDQLVLIHDVTKEVIQSFDSGKTDEERLGLKQRKIKELENSFSDSLGMICNVITFYNGGKYSLYGYKRYSDIRLVFAPEANLGYFGGDPDNFTYPRYCLDMSFFRIYDETGKPLKTKNYFKWSENGVKEGDPVFVIGNPGFTNRLLTISQLEFLRDYFYHHELDVLTNIVGIYHNLMKKYPDKKEQYENTLFGYSNSQKVIANVLKGLKDPYLMGKKIDFEKTFKNVISKNPVLKLKYGTIWDELESIQKEKSKIYNEYALFNFKKIGASKYFSLAKNVLEYAHQMEKNESERDFKYQSSQLEATRSGLVLKVDDFEKGVLPFFLQELKNIYGESNSDIKNILRGLECDKAAEYLLSTTILADKEKAAELLFKPGEIVNSGDPAITFMNNNKVRIQEATEKFIRLWSLENAKVQSLGNAIYEVFGTTIPPDGTFTLRISDGIVKGYEYNGTIAPPLTTFYGLYDRYYSYNKKDPWDLPELWKNPPRELDLKTPMNFVSTCDTYGGNSGSPLVNKNLEIVGLNFDRNIEGMPRDFIYTDESGRNVAVHSLGILEALKDVYKADRIYKEIREGRIPK